MKSSEAESGEVLAIFDLDGTLTRRDTYLHYVLGYLRRHPRKWLVLPVLAAGVAAHWSKSLSNTQLKCLFLNQVLAGQKREALARWTTDFSRQVVASGLRSQARARIDEHRRLGHRLVLASASLDLYAGEIGRLLGFDQTVATRIGWTEDGRLARNLAGPNLRGPAKLDATRAACADAWPRCIRVVYTDHHSDAALLLAAHRRVAVHPTRRLRALAAEMALDIQVWE